VKHHKLREKIWESVPNIENVLKKCLKCRESMIIHANIWENEVSVVKVWKFAKCRESMWNCAKCWENMRKDAQSYKKC